MSKKKDDELTLEERERKSRIRLWLFTGAVILVLFTSFSMVTCIGNIGSAMNEASAEEARLAPVPYLYTDTKVAQGQRQMRYDVLLKERDGRLLFKVDLTNMRGNALDWFGEEKMVCEYELEEKSKGNFSGRWYQYTAENDNGVTQSKGNVTVRKDGDMYIGSETKDGAGFSREFVLTRKRFRQF